MYPLNPFSQALLMSCISLFDTGPKLDNFCAKDFTFGSSPFPLSEILVAFLVAFTAADRFFKRLFIMQYFNCKILHEGRFRSLDQTSPGATGGHSVAVPPQMTACAPQTKIVPPQGVCAPKKLTGSELLECKSRPKTPKLVFTA